MIAKFLRFCFVGTMIAGPAMAGGDSSKEGLLDTRKSFFNSNFCRQESCRFIEKRTISARTSGFADFVRYTYLIRNGSSVTVTRYDPLKNKLAGNIIEEAELTISQNQFFRQDFNQARLFVNTFAGVLIKPSEFQRCFRESKESVNREAVLYETKRPCTESAGV